MSCFRRFLAWGVLFSVVCSSGSLAAVPGIPFRFKDETRIFLDDRESRILISKDCAGEQGRYRCEAHLAWKKGVWRSFVFETTGGANKGALICRKALHARVVIGRTKDGIENSFCLFPDRSMISCGAFR